MHQTAEILASLPEYDVSIWIHPAKSIRYPGSLSKAFGCNITAIPEQKEETKEETKKEPVKDQWAAIKQSLLRLEATLSADSSLFKKIEQLDYKAMCLNRNLRKMKL